MIRQGMMDVMGGDDENCSATCQRLATFESQPNEQHDDSIVTLTTTSRATFKQEHSRHCRHRWDTTKAVVLATLLLAALLLQVVLSSSFGSSQNTIVPLTESSSTTTRILTKGKHKTSSTAADDTDPMDFGEYSCNDLYQHAMDSVSQCAFAKTCNDGDGILFGSIFYCSTKYSTEFLLLLLGPPLVLLLVILFRILGSTAEEFFSPGLECLSLEMGLPERFAGVTLLALGNGAPDVASTVNAILNDAKKGYLLALGELTGAAMVASTIIVGAVVFVSDGVVCRGSLVRDVCMFVITMVVVYCAFDDGTVSVSEIHVFVGLYLAYVLVVLLADVYHRRHNYFGSASIAKMTLTNKQESLEVKEKQEQEAIAMGDEQETETTALTTSGTREHRSYSVASYELDHPKPKKSVEEAAFRRSHSDQVGGRPTPSSPKPSTLARMIEALSNYDVVDDLEQQQQRPAQESSPTNGSTAVLEIKSSHDSEKSNGGKEEEEEGAADDGWGKLEMDGTEPLMVFHPHHGGIVDLKHTERGVNVTTDETMEVEAGVCPDGSAAAAAAIGPSPAPQSWAEAWTMAWPELITYFRKFWRETYYNGEYNAVDKFLMTCELPFTLMRMLTIPVPCACYYCRPLLALSIALSPLWLWYYFINQFDVNIVRSSTTLACCMFILPFILGLMVLRFAPRGEIPPRLSVAVPITLIGFCVSATWLDLIADLLVSLLSFFGIILHIPSTIMGITVLAWGNSSQDLIANMTVARKGLSTMAITASFAGPVFNILIGLGIGLSLLYSMEKPGHAIVVELNNPLRLGFLFSVLNGVLVIFCGICINRGFLPKRYGYVALVLYFAYAIASITI